MELQTEFVDKLRHGDDDAFTRLVREHAPRMLATARRLLHNEDDAQDAVQEAFLSAARAIDGFAGDAKLSTWLHRIVVNAALMKMRARRRRPEEPIDDLLPRFDAEGSWSGRADTLEPCDALLARRETRATVRRSIDRLPERYRTVLLLRDIEELDTQETATLLGTTQNTIKIRLHRARQALRTLLRHELAPEDPPAVRRGEAKTRRSSPGEPPGRTRPAV